jgi:hypothetical protein
MTIPLGSHMSVIERRLYQAMRVVTFRRIYWAGTITIVFLATCYVGAIAISSAQNASPDARFVAKYYAAPISLIALEVFFVAIAFITLLKIVWDIRQEAGEYAQKLGSDPTPRSAGAEISPVDISEPNKIFQVSRQRLLDEAIRIDKISRRNLIIGIVFSFVALAMLASPLISGLLLTSPEPADSGVLPWIAHYYLPRFAIGLLLQLVGFFFLRLYVANELDLKHNKNEITNLELRMMGLQIAKDAGDAASRKEVVKSLMNTERNFIIKKNEKTTSTEALSEYNDLKDLIGKLINKIPGAGK